MKLSIIIPVYKVEDTLERCVNSILKQSFTDYEMILVDDGSPDNCGRMCDNIASRDNRVKVIHKKNGGLSDARNAGINIVCGEYITFIDSDDYIGANALEPLMLILAKHPEYDILEYPAFVFYGSRKQRMLSFENKEYHCTSDYWLKCRAHEHSYAWNKIYRKSLYDNIRFPIGILFEDVPTLWNLLHNTNIVATTNIGLYYYCANDKGITSTAGGYALNMLLESHVRILNEIGMKKTNSFLKLYYLCVLNIQLDVCRMTGNKPIIPYMRFPVFLKSHISILREIKLLLLYVCGIKGLCKINILSNKIRCH